LKFQTEDPEFWPDHPEPFAAYVHRLSIRREFAGRNISHAMLSWEVEHARTRGKGYLRLDCEAGRPRLRALYENFGFIHHSDKQVGPYFVARYEYKI
jgi:GNAT superfamily N-acetyltransferase